MCSFKNVFDSCANYKLFLNRQLKRKREAVLLASHCLCGTVYKLTGGPSAPGIPGKPGFPVGP